MAVKPIPEGYHSLTPYLIVNDGVAALEFYKKALNATELFRMPTPNGKIGHAEIRVGDSVFMIADEHPDMGFRSAKTLGGCPVGMMIYLENVDDRFKQALAAGGKEVRPLQNQFYGDRSGTFEDPFGICWTLSTHVEDVPPDEMENRAKAAMQQGGK